ncbi:ribonuclease H-like domain-containing protein, partial [Tanacetum coccineum]
MMTYGIPTSVQVLPAQQPPAQFSSLYAFAPGPQAHQSLMHYYGAPIMHPALVYYAPAFLHAFHAMALQNPNWNMDTGASSHLADNTVILTCWQCSTTWHRRLGHPGVDVLRRLESKNLISYRKSKLSALCHACPLGKHAKLPFYNSESSVDSVFEIIHSDIWTSPFPSESVIKYYAIFLDHFSHFVWVYPLHKKYDLFDNFVAFRAYVNKQFNVDIKALQSDHGGEYDNTRFHDLFRQNDIQFWFSCPRTSQQNGKSE